MASTKGNEVALNAVLEEMFPKAQKGLVQTRLERNRPLVWSKYFTSSASPTWQRIDVEGYELLVFGPEAFDNTNGASPIPLLPAYVRFGSQGPSVSTAITETEGALPVFPGSRILIPQGCGTFWFLPSTSYAWRIVVIRVPHVEVQSQPPQLVSVFGPVEIDGPTILTAQTLQASYDTATELDLSSLGVGLYRVVATTDCYISQIPTSGTAVTTASGAYLPAKRPEYFRVITGRTSFSVIKDASAGKLIATLSFL